MTFFFIKHQKIGDHFHILGLSRIIYRLSKKLVPFIQLVSRDFYNKAAHEMLI